MVKDGIIYPPSGAEGHVFCQTESNIPQNNSNLKQLDRDDGNVCQQSRALYPLPYSSGFTTHLQQTPAGPFTTPPSSCSLTSAAPC